MNIAKKGMWVEIENQILSPSERAPQVPEDTKATPLMMWTKGLLVENTAAMGDQVTVETLSGRKATGTLVDLNPRHSHDYGDPVKELIEVGMELKLGR